MSVVNILNIQVLDNPTRFTNPFQFEITFECTSPLQDDLEWKIIYVGSAEDERYDQVLDCIMVGPVPVGINKFVYQADAPNSNLIPATDITGVTVVLLTCSYKEQEFVRVGYYVNNEYEDEQLRMEPPTTPTIDKLARNILADKPRVTRFPIKWDAVDEIGLPPTIAEGEGGDEPEDLYNDEDNDNHGGGDIPDSEEFPSHTMAGNSIEHQMIADNLQSSEKVQRNPFSIPFPSAVNSNNNNQMTM